ncbi:MAG: hypothetical protein IJ794_06365 [Lachnospiraceae bacterium]|nr:hypothetical protein [Lachnospiraceae bacterium]
MAAQLKKEDEEMCQALRELMEPELLQSRLEGERRGEKRGKEKAERKGILVIARTLRQLGHSDDEIRRCIVENYELPAAEIDALIIQA